MKILGIGAILGIVVISSSACRVGPRSKEQADSIGSSFLARLDMGSAHLEDAKRIIASGDRRGWLLTYRIGKERYWCNVRDEQNYPDSVQSLRVYDRTRGTQRPNSKPAIGSQSSARQALLSMWTKLGNQYPYKLDGFQFATHEGRSSGMASGAFLLKVHGHVFFSFVGVALAIDAADGGLYSYTANLSPPAVSDSPAKLSVAKAFAHLHFRPPLDNLSSWQSELGWYVPSGKKVAQLGWRFYRPKAEAHAWIVDANDGKVQRPRP